MSCTYKWDNDINPGDHSKHECDGNTSRKHVCKICGEEKYA